MISVPPSFKDSEPPIVHSTVMKVAADSTAVVTPVAKSTGKSVASLMSSAIRYSGFLWSPEDEMQLVVAAVGEPTIEQMMGQPFAPAPLRGHARVDLHDEADARREQGKIEQREQQHSAGVALLERIEDHPVPHIHAVGGGEIEQDQQQDRARQQPCSTVVRPATQKPEALCQNGAAAVGGAISLESPLSGSRLTTVSSRPAPSSVAMCFFGRSRS